MKIEPKTLIQALKKAEKQIAPETLANATQFLRTPKLPTWALESFAELLQRKQWEEIDRRFGQTLSFGTAGIRGRTIGVYSTAVEKKGKQYLHAAIGSACMNDFNVIATTLGLFQYSKNYLKTACEFPERPKLVIAYDTRYFSQHFCKLIASTWIACGGDVYIFDGPRSTPQLSFSVRYLKTIAGVMITASHNPFFDNGYKVYGPDGAQIEEKAAAAITQNIQKITLADTLPYVGIHLDGALSLPHTLDDAYLETCEDSIVDLSLFRKMRYMRIVYTPLHGTGSVCIPTLLKNFSWNIHNVEQQMSMDSAFPTVASPNPDNRETLALAIKEAQRVHADAIIATDPDADRMSLLLKDTHEEWQLLSGNTIAVLLAEYRYTRLMRYRSIAMVHSRMAIVKSYVTTPLLNAFAKKHGLKCVETHTGFKWIGAKLKSYEEKVTTYLFRTKGFALNYTRCTFEMRRDQLYRHSTYLFLGAEESCGFLCNDAVRDKDGNAAALMACELIAYLKSKNINFTEYLDEIYYQYGYFHEDLLSFTLEGQKGTQTIRHLMQSYRQHPPQKMSNTRVLKIIDFLHPQGMVDADGDAVPPADFLVLRLNNGCSVMVRPSGTEPKIKFYLFSEAPVKRSDDLEKIKQETKKRIHALKKWVQADVEKRIQSL